jgi:hypothetical protein
LTEVLVDRSKARLIWDLIVGLIGASSATGYCLAWAFTWARLRRDQGVGVMTKSEAPREERDLEPTFLELLRLAWAIVRARLRRAVGRVG